jgi:hypothetical protein
MSTPPGAIPFADLTAAHVCRADEVHVFDEDDPGFGLSLPVGRAGRTADDTLRVLLVVADHDCRDLQVEFLRTMVLAASRPPTHGRAG